jgi:two-component system, NtrC family, sensor histidine kinase GlrK
MRSLLFQAREAVASPPETPGVGLSVPAGRWRIDLGLLRPRTMSGLVAAGCLLAAVPLLLALLLAASQLNRLAQHSEKLVNEGVAVVRLGSQLRDDISNLERAVRQYAALRDPALGELVKSRMVHSESTLHDIEDLQVGPLADPVFTAQRELVEAAKLWVDGAQQPDSLEQLARHVHAIGDQADVILSTGRGAIDDQIGRLQSASGGARRILLISSMTLIPLTALLALTFSTVVTRPLRKLGEGIVDLGNARYDQPVAIHFPTEMQQLGRRLDWLRRRLAQLEADKESFLRNVSHELKTPLASLHEGAALLRDEAVGPLTAPQREVVAILVESTGELAGLIQNLLDYAEWRKQRRHPPMEWFEARPFVEEVVARHKLSLEGRRLSTELRVHSGRLFGHRPQLRVALENLLGNAIKHAPPETAIDIDLEVSGAQCGLSVRDRGRGVPEQEKQMIFEPFVRGTEAEEAGTRGTGIGLSIVHETILSHKGTVEVEDANPGACFKMAWPCPPEAA